MVLLVNLKPGSSAEGISVVYVESQWRNTKTWSVSSDAILYLFQKEIALSELGSFGIFSITSTNISPFVSLRKESLVDEPEARGKYTDRMNKYEMQREHLFSTASNVPLHSWLKMWKTWTFFLVTKSLLVSLSMISLMWSKVLSMNCPRTTEVHRQNLRSFLHQQFEIKIN